jgi:pre-mRNA-splicing factor ATP-dependent RNA helicase DHX38/PRP16
LVIYLSICIDADGKEGEDYKGDSKFAAHLKTQQSTSAHTRTRTLKEQREYLPAFACREDLMRVIRDNQGTPLEIPTHR